MSQIGVKKISSGNQIKILNDEKISPKPVLKAPTVPVPMEPTKQISTLKIAKPKTSPSKRKQEHYVMQTIKNDSKTINKSTDTKTSEIDYDSIDFVLAADDDEHADGAESGNPSGEITEEFHLSGDECDEEESGGQVKEIVEHVCGKCYKTFRRIKSLKRHLDFCRFDSGYHLRKAEMLKNLEKIEKDAVVMENKDICFCCSESYDTFHLGHINCPDCPKSFKTQMSYERHIFITHSELNDFPCSICNAKLRSEALLKLHEHQHRCRGKPFACKICGKDFTRSYHLKRHQKYSACSTNENDTVVCKVCDKVFYRLDNLRSHLKQHLGTHAVKKPEYMCHVCKNCFYSLSTLNIHIRTHTGEKPFDCDLCDKKFSALVALKKHRRYHTGEKPYTCTVCNQSFAVKEVLNRHMKRHTGERPHKCDECGKSFIQATQLRNHARTHLRPYECDVCEEKFKSEKQLDRHIKEHTKNKRGSKKYQCTVCFHSFKFESYLQIHTELCQDKKLKRTKRIERTDCAVCEKNFDSVDTLKEHMRTVHDCDPDDIFGDKPSADDEKIVPRRAKRQKLSPKKNTPSATEISMATSDDSKGSLAPIDGTAIAATNVGSDSNGNNNGVVVREFLVDEVPASGSSAEQAIILQSETYTVIPLDTFNNENEKTSEEPTEPNDIKPADAKVEVMQVVKKEQRKSLAASLAAAIADDEEEVSSDDGSSYEMTEDDIKLKENVAKLLDMLVDNVTLKKFGWPNVTEEIVLCKVIENCGHDLSNDSAQYDGLDYSSRMREYVKLLFTLVIHNDMIKELLNNYPIDEVIEYVLGNDDEDSAAGSGDEKEDKKETKHIID